MTEGENVVDCAQDGLGRVGNGFHFDIRGGVWYSVAEEFREAQSRRGECSLFHSRVPPGDDVNTLDMRRVLTRLGDGKRTPRKGSTPIKRSGRHPLPRGTCRCNPHRPASPQTRCDDASDLTAYFLSFVAPKAPITWPLVKWPLNSPATPVGRID